MSEENASKAKIIVRCGAVSIATNFLLAIFKIIVGVLANSIAIISDALHGLVDAISGFVVVVTGKMAGSKSAEKTKRVEFVATLIIVGIIVAVGITTMVESIKKIIEPEPVEYSAPIVTILIVGLFAKLGLGIYLKKMGRKIKSSTLIASGVESLNDVLLSAAVIVSIAVYLVWGVDIEAYVGILISLVILKFGVSVLLDK